MTSVNKGKLYKDLLSAYTKAHSESKSKQTIQENVNIIWNSLKKNTDVTYLIESEILQLNKIKTKRQLNLQKYWMGVCEKSKVTTEPSNSIEKENSSNSANISSIESSSVAHVVHDVQTKKFTTPGQDKIKNEILVLDSDIAALKKRQNCGLMNEDTNTELRLKKTKLDTFRKVLKKKQREMLRHRKRLQKKINLDKACVDNPDLKKKLNVRDKNGRPRIEDDQPFLLQAIIDLALHGSAAHEKRRDETIRTVRTLDELVDKLHQDYGFTLSRSATYLRLLPRKSNSTEGKRHVNTVPVKLIKASNDSHKQHIGSKFAMTTINHIDELASMLGPNEVTYISQDDKAKIPVGLPAVVKQAPLLMHMEYRVKLPDHDFMIAKGHKLTPSVYGFCEVKPNGGGNRSAISYSGPTFAAIRSTKHCSSTALSHARDINTIFEKPEFSQYTHTTSNGVSKTKPVLVSIVDGGPDENPRYDKVIQMQIHHFIKYDLDAAIVACNAPGRSSFNRVERRMAPLSKALVGIILPHDHYGTHLDSQGRTNNIDLEKTNFSYAGKALAEVWSETIIDGHVTIAEYVEPENSDIEESSIILKDIKWCDRHVLQSQYLLQILKCSDRNCCKEFRSSLFKFLPPNGLPAPLPIKQTNDGLKLAELSEIETYASLFVTLALDEKHKREMMSNQSMKEILYDSFCPSVQSKLSDRTCACGRYFSSISSMKNHLKVNLTCKKLAKSVKPVKILGQRQNEKLALIKYDDNEEDVEWVYDMDVETDEIFLEPETPMNEAYSIECIVTPIWEDV